MWISNGLQTLVASAPFLLAFNLCLAVLGAEAGYVLDAYRLVQMDVDGSPLGSRSVRLSQYATLQSDGAKMFRSVVVIPFTKATDRIVEGLLQEKGISGIIFVLPRNYDNGALSDEDTENLIALEKALINSAIPVPVYFVVENDDIVKMVEDIEQNIKRGNHPSKSTGGYMMVVKGVDAKPLKSSQTVNFEGWLPGSEGGRPGNTKAPTVVIHAHYDASCVAPAICKGAGSNGSGTLALLALVRMFGRLYADKATRPRYNIVFLLSGGGKLDSAGLKVWLRTANSRLMDTVEVVINLDSLSGWGTEKSGSLFLHHSKPREKDPLAMAWYDNFDAAAALEGVNLEQSRKKVNLRQESMDWEHEHVAQHRILSLTISGMRTPVPASIMDRPNLVNLTAVAGAARMVAEAIGLRLFKDRSGDYQIFAERSTFDASIPFMRQWAQVLNSNMHMTPYFSAKSVLGTALSRHLSEYTKVSTNAFKLDEQYKFYDGEKSMLQVYKTAGAAFDIVFLAAWALYLALLFVVLKVLTQGWSELLALFKPTPKKWKKSA